jgi:hypothetical protein
MSALTPKADMCGATGDVCYGPKADISEQAPKLSYLFFVGRAASPRTCRRCQDHLHYRTTWQACSGNAGGRWSPLPQHQPWVGATDNPHDWEDAIAPLAKGERGRAFKAISPGMLPPLGIIFGLFCRVHWAVHTWERGQPREPLSRTGRCSITVLPPSRPFCQSRSETRRLGAGA